VPGGIRRALLRAEPGRDDFLRFSEPVDVHVTNEPREVPALLERVERGAASGLWAVGFVGYEAASGFDPALTTHAPAAGPAPLAAFSFFRGPVTVVAPTVSSSVSRAGSSDEAPRGAPSRRARPAEVRAGVAADAFKASIERVREAVAAGSTYQVNLTFPFFGSFSDGGGRACEELLWALLAPGEAPYAALVEGAEWAVVSLSPELFFERSGGTVVMRPMKGTRPRGRFGEEDRRRADELSGSPKDRAENLMIVDMVRNDLGRVARAGSVETSTAFAVERYPTVWQMTSTVAARSEARLPELFGALFPCASVTGAPKPATMRFIRELEAGPRGVYCGAVGRVEPGGRARFAVAIRTLELDLAARTFRYGVGAGITWDSEPEEEWRECLAKARVLDGAPPDFHLLETMLWKPEGGIELLDLHLERLRASAEFFGFEAGARRGRSVSKTGKASIEGEARGTIAARCAGLPPRPHKVRLLLARTGEIRVEAEILAVERRAWRMAIARKPFPSMEVFAFHKTSFRARYEAAWKDVPAGVDEVVLVNEHGELTEGTRTNLFVEIDGGWLTPPREAGLLAGVFRESLLRAGRAAEATLYPRDLARAHRIRLGNALRGWIPVELPVVGLPGP
jgi:para-aminobenzoate synthetase/4-amino-4-deoxychorismate lyase